MPLSPDPYSALRHAARYVQQFRRKTFVVKLGGKAEVVVDAYPDRKLQAKITEVNQQAEYNPRLSLTQKERSNMVFWIKVSVENSDGILKPGMPADVTLD